MYIRMYAENVRALREEMDWSPRELAAAAGVSAKVAARAESELPLRARNARAVAAALGVKPGRHLGEVVS